MAHQLERLIWGGQTGIDPLGLEVAYALGNPRLRDRFGLTGHELARYSPCIRADVQQARGGWVN